MMVFTVTGLFKELSRETSDAVYELRHFARTFVVVPQNTGYCIRNETIFVTSATQEQVREFKRSQHQPAPGAIASTSAAAAAAHAAAVATSPPGSSLQNRLNPGGVGNVATVAILPVTSLGATTSPVVPSGSVVATAGPGPVTHDDNTKMQMIQAMCASSQMNVDWSRK